MNQKSFFALLLISIISSCKIINIVDKPKDEKPGIKKYELIELFLDGYANVTYKGKWGRIDTTGKEVIPTIYDAIQNIDNESYSIIHQNGKAGVISNSGEIKVKPTFDDIYYIESMRFAVNVAGLWGIVNEYGEEIIANQFDEMITSYDDYALVSKSYKWGVINIETGKFEIPLSYDEIQFGIEQNENQFLVKSEIGWGVYDLSKSAEVVECRYDYLQVLSANLYSAESYVQTENGDEISLRGVVNDKNNVVVPVEYDQIYYYYGDQMIVGEKENQFFVFSGDGTLLGKVENYYDVEPFDDFLFSDGYLAIANENKWQFLGIEGKLLGSKKYDGTTGFDGNGFARVCIGCSKFADDYNNYNFHGGKWGQINKQGEEVVPIQYSDINYYYSNGLAIVNVGCVIDSINLHCDGGKEGAVDQKGNLILKAKYDKVMFSDRGIIEVNNGGAYDEGHFIYKGGKWGFFDLSGNELAPLIYDDYLELTSAGLYAVQQGELWGLMDFTGRLITNIKYNVLYATEDGLLIVNEGCKPNHNNECTGGEWYIINEEGERVLNQNYENLYQIYGNNNFFVMKNGKYGVINLDGATILPFEFDYIMSLGSGNGYITNKGGDFEHEVEGPNGKWGLYSTTGQAILPCLYDEIQDYTDYQDLLIIGQNGKYGLASGTGKLYTQLVFDQILNSYQDLLPVTKGDKMGALNMKGEIVIPIEYESDKYIFGNEFFMIEKNSELFHED